MQKDYSIKMKFLINNHSQVVTQNSHLKKKFLLVVIETKLIICSNRII